MKANELLRLYQAGERDFSGENLRGQNLKGKDLSGADFSGADIRGANFSNATLVGANFSQATAGLQRRWVVGLLSIAILFLLLSSLFPGVMAALLVDYIANPSEPGQSLGGWLGIAITIVFWVIALRRGVIASLSFAVVAFAVIIAVSVLGRGAVAVAGVGAGTGAVAGIFAVAFAFVVAVAVAVAVVVVVAVVVAVAILVAVAVTSTGVGPFAVAVAGAVLSMLASAYIGWRALAGDERDAWVRSIAVAFAALGGTRLQGADLTDASFTQARLKSTDLRNAVLIRTNWHQAKKLDRARVGGTILLKPAVRDLLVTHRGAKKPYVGLTLKGANLIGSDLSDADLTEADVSEATLERAWLERANLTKTQALNTNFHQANLTGACLEDWSINSATHLEDANCDYVYLLSNQQERRPSSGNFAPGEFTKLFEEVLDTIDLIFRNGVDWKAFVTSFKQVQVENEDTELTIQSIENKGDGVVVVKVQASPDADKEKIHSDFTRHYDLALKAVEERYKAELQAKDEQIEIYRQQGSDMKEIVGLLASRPINVDVKATADSKAMQGSSDQSRKIEIGDIGGDFNASGSALNLGDISGTVTNTINQLPSSADPNQPGIKELLTQLKEAIATESTLNDDDKAEALEQVKALAEAGRNPGDGTRQKLAKRATRILKGIIDELPTAAKLAEACSQLLPAIASLLSL